MQITILLPYILLKNYNGNAACRASGELATCPGSHSRVTKKDLNPANYQQCVQTLRAPPNTDGDIAAIAHFGFSQRSFHQRWGLKSEPVWAICCRRPLTAHYFHLGHCVLAVDSWLNVYLASALAGNLHKAPLLHINMHACKLVQNEFSCCVRLQLNLHHRVQLIKIRDCTWQLNNRSGSHTLDCVYVKMLQNSTKKKQKNISQP